MEAGCKKRAFGEVRGLLQAAGRPREVARHGESSAARGTCEHEEALSGREKTIRKGKLKKNSTRKIGFRKVTPAEELVRSRLIDNRPKRTGKRKTVGKKKILRTGLGRGGQMTGRSTP